MWCTDRFGLSLIGHVDVRLDEESCQLVVPKKQQTDRKSQRYHKSRDNNYWQEADCNKHASTIFSLYDYDTLHCAKITHIAIFKPQNRDTLNRKKILLLDSTTLRKI